jgi:hypothetical protein
MTEKNISIDILKAIAAILITNSHMKILYHPYEIFATGGAIGDVLFFFCSGFTLFLKPMGRFDNWYKKRINRIYFTVFAWAILATLFFGKDQNIIYLFIHGGDWFVSCIMIYYILLYLISKFMSEKLIITFIASSIIIIIWYLVIKKPDNYNMYGSTYFKWGHYFLFMLFGAILGISKKKLTYSFKYDFLKLTGCVVIFYVILYLSKKYTLFEEIQIISLLPLMGITFYFYKVANSNFLNKIYIHPFSGSIIRIIAGLCLEIYLVQKALFTNTMNHIFPLNLIIMFLIILIAAYILRCLSRIFAQTFKDQDFNWKIVFKLY